jgi:hypothetical protein
VEGAGLTARYRYIVTDNDIVLVDPDDAPWLSSSTSSATHIETLATPAVFAGVVLLELQESQEQGGTN